MNRSRSLSILSATVCVPLLFTGCETPGKTSLLGAGVGAAIASAGGHSALRGAGIGAGAGALLGILAQRERRRGYEEGYYDRRGGRRAYYYEEHRDYPYGTRTAQRGYVRSPYSPHNLIDVRDIPRGAKVADSSTGRVFINP